MDNSTYEYGKRYISTSFNKLNSKIKLSGLYSKQLMNTVLG